MEELRVRLKEAMTKKGYRPIDICNRCDIPRSAMTYYLNGRSKSMTGERLHKIAEVLDVTEAYLLGFDTSDVTIEEDRLLAIFRHLDDQKQKNLIAYAKFLEEQ